MDTKFSSERTRKVCQVLEVTPSGYYATTPRVAFLGTRSATGRIYWQKWGLKRALGD